MPLFNLVFFARTEHVQQISVSKQYIWLLNINCTSCNEPFPKQVGVSLTQEVPMEKQHATAHFTAKCKNCQRKCYITILPHSTYSCLPNQNNLIKDNLVSFECRGVEIVDAVIADQFRVSASDSGTVFQDADFSDLWAEYDEARDVLVTVEGQKFEMIRGKDK